MTLQRGISVLQGFRIRTANDLPDRDPLTITIEGSNEASSSLTSGSSWTLIYNGVTGLSVDPGRLSWGSYQFFSNRITFRSYRFLITSKRGVADATQYADVEFVSTITDISVSDIYTLTGTSETVYGIWNTVAGGSSTGASAGLASGNYPGSESPPNLFDGNANTKYTSFGSCVSNGDPSVTCAVGTGFYLTLQRGSSLLQGFRIRTANDLPDRDPLTITIEGSNEASSSLTSGSSWTLIYNDVTGLSTNPGRLIWGPYKFFSNFITFSSCRFLVTTKRGVADATQYSDVEFVSTITDTSVSDIYTLTGTSETVYGIWNTVAGGSSIAASAGLSRGNYPTPESPPNLFDGNANTKYTSFGSCASNSDPSVACALDTGFYLTLQRGISLLQGFRIRTANDLPDRDPLTITIEGSNDVASSLTSGSSWTLIYTGVTGLSVDPGRLSWGSYQFLSNLVPFSSYRFLITSKRGVTDATQYADVEFVSAAVPTPSKRKRRI